MKETKETKLSKLMYTKFILMYDLLCARCVRQIKIHLHSKHTDG